MSKPLPTRPEFGAGDKKSSPAPAKPKPPRKPSPWPWPRWRRVVVSALIAFHVVAVFSAPWLIQLRDVFEPPWPPDRDWLYENGQVVTPEKIDRDAHPPVRPIVPESLAGPLARFPLVYHYANLLYINNGYDFFSPDPVGSFVIRYHIVDSMGQTIKQGEFPDHDARWPRLLYHRYMMLADQSATPRPETEGWDQKIADRLLAEYNGASVTLETVRHHLLTPGEVLAGERQDAAWTYQAIGQPKNFVSSAPPAEAGAAAPDAVAIPGGGR